MITSEATANATLSEQVPGAGNSILIADDDPLSRVILQTWLEKWNFNVIVAENGVKAWDILQQENAPELLILDWVMPGLEGIELCRRIRQRRQNAYILLVTANGEKGEVVRGLEAGADDYLTKPFDADELRARLKVGQRILALHHQLRFQATHDALTGVWSRGAVWDMLPRELRRAARSQTPTGVLMLDLDHFKTVNDTWGHLAGDLVLKEVVQRVVRTLRTYDIVGRYGGEEFLVVLPECRADQVQATAERICAAVSESSIQLEESAINVTVSIGGAVAYDMDPAENIVGNADGALFRAKAAGRNRVSMHPSPEVLGNQRFTKQTV